MIRCPLLLLAILPLSTQAAEQAAPASAGSLLQVAFGLAVVLALMAAAAWVLKRMGMTGTAGNSVARVVGGVSVGSRERVIVLEVADQWIVVGVAPGRVNPLATMPRQEVSSGPIDTADGKNFSAWLRQTIEKRNGN